MVIPLFVSIASFESFVFMLDVMNEPYVSLGVQHRQVCVRLGRCHHRIATNEVCLNLPCGIFDFQTHLLPNSLKTEWFTPTTWF